MIYIYYLDINSVSNKEIAIIKKILPLNFQRRVSGKLIQSKQSLLGRSLLYHCLIKLKKEPDEDSIFKLSNSGKLFIEDELQFNISHSKSYVALAIANNDKTVSIGVDIEKERKIQNLNDLLGYFAISEKKAVLTSHSRNNEFLKIWTRKEAFYKAVGIGIHHANSLKNIICLNKYIKYSNDYWYLESFKLHKTHICSCVTNRKTKNVFREVKINEILKRIN